MHLTERPKRLQMSLPAPTWCKFRDSEAIWISQSLQQILSWWLFPLEPIRTVFPVAFPSIATVVLSYRWELQKNHFMLYPNDCVLFCVGTSMLWLTLASSPSRGRTWMWAGPDTLSQSATPSMPPGGSAGYVWGFFCLFFFVGGVGGWGVKHRMCYILLHQSKSQVQNCQLLLLDIGEQTHCWYESEQSLWAARLSAQKSA